MQSIHGKCISISSENDLKHVGIGRDHYLDAELRASVYAKISNNEDLLFLGNDISEPTKKSDYRIFIHGIMPCGTKTTVEIVDIEPYVDIKVNVNETVSGAKTRIEGYAMDATSDGIDLATLRMEEIIAKDFMFYNHEQSKFIRVFFHSLSAMSAMIKYCLNSGVKTYSNSTSSYYRTVARIHEFNLSGWNIIRNYTKLIKSSSASNSKAEYIFEVSISDIIGIHSDDEIVQTAIQHGYDQSIVRYENMIIASFDIEMIPVNLDNFPDAERSPKDEIFMIAITFHFSKRKDSILNVVLSLRPCDPIDDVVIIHCKSEKCLISSFARCMALMQPDFITEFNGGGFDWKNVVKKAQLCKVLSQFMNDMSLVDLATWEMKPSLTSYVIDGRYSRVLTIGRSFTMREIKINGATAPSKVRSLKMVGYVGFDTLVVFKQLEPNADSHKLNECLRRCNLGSKDGLDIREMFRIYKHGTASEMKIVAHYCFIDTFKLQQLLIKKNVIQDHREVANLSYTSLSDTFMFAGGSRMRNLLMNRAEKRGYLFDVTYKPDVENKDAKFPGAHVVPPKKGIVKPLLRIDEFANEHPKDLSIDKLAECYEYIESNFDRIYHSDDIVEDAPEFIKPYIEYTNANYNQYPVSGLDYSSLYPSIIMTYNISPEKLIVDETYAKELEAMGKTLQHVSFPYCGKMVHAWFVRHNNVKEDYSICGSLLIELFDQRARLKGSLHKWSDVIYELEQEMKPFIARNEEHKFPRLDEYNEAKFNYISSDSKQRAVKIFMNTLYGAMGEMNSFICAIEVAASVTTMGKYNLMLARSFVEDQLHMKTYYGDSVSGDTPIMIKRGLSKRKEILSIEDLDTRFESYIGGKECIDYADADVYVHTENGYSKILKVIRHRTNKRMYRVSTRIGSVIVTKDHSLLDSNKQKITPRDCKIGTQLLHWDHDPSDCMMLSSDISEVADINHDVDHDIAYVQGIFLRSGYCTFATDTTDATLQLTGRKSILKRCIAIFKSHYTDVHLRFVEQSNYANSYKVEAVGNVNRIVDLWVREFYTTRGLKKVSYRMLNLDMLTKMIFMRGYCAANNNIDIAYVDNQIIAHGLFVVLSDIGFTPRIAVCNGSCRYKILMNAADIGDDSAIQSIEYIGKCSGYVYDLETASHHFAAGVGRIVVHNTDSLYVSCNKKYFKEYDRQYYTGKIDKIAYGKKLVAETITQIEIAKNAVNAHLIADNGSKHLKMAYEEVLYPVAFLSKKKYYGVPHESKIDFYPKNLFMRGLEIVKRGSSDVLKDIVNQIIREVMDISSTTDIIEIVRKAIQRFFTTEWPVDVFAKSKVYRADKNNVSVKTMIRRYQDIGYPKIPEQNIRFKTVVCKYYPWVHNENGTINHKISIGDCMELVDRVVEEGLEIDLDYYFENELTGQMARLISFCDVVQNSVQDSLPAEIDIDVIDEFERAAYEKELYKKKEELLFNAAKKFISSMAKQYSNPFINKGSLYKNTWELATRVLSDQRTNPFTLNQMNLMEIVKSGSIDKLNDDIIDWAETYCVKRNVQLSSAKKLKLRAIIGNVEKYIRDNDLVEKILIDIAQCKKVFIKHIHDTYGYTDVCNYNLPYTKLADLMVIPEELEYVVRSLASKVYVDDAHARWILDTIMLDIALVGL